MEVIIKCSDDVRGGINIYGEPIRELVRCKDCKHWWECKPRDGGDCDHYAMNTKADDFCSYGEREGE